MNISEALKLAGDYAAVCRCGAVWLMPLSAAHVCNLTEHKHDTHECCCGYVWHEVAS